MDDDDDDDDYDYGGGSYTPPTPSSSAAPKPIPTESSEGRVTVNPDGSQKVTFTNGVEGVYSVISDFPDGLVTITHAPIGKKLVLPITLNMPTGSPSTLSSITQFNLSNEGARGTTITEVPTINIETIDQFLNCLNDSPEGITIVMKSGSSINTMAGGIRKFNFNISSENYGMIDPLLDQSKVIISYGELDMDSDYKFRYTENGVTSTYQIALNSDGIPEVINDGEISIETATPSGAFGGSFTLHQNGTLEKLE